MRIHAIQTGDVQIKRRHLQARRTSRGSRVLDVLADRTWAPRLPILCWAIEHPEGLLMVDTGESAHANDPGYQPRWSPFARTCERRWVGPEQEVAARLRSLGLDPRDVRWVVMTHMHGDHAGGVGHFADSEILMSAVEAKLAFARTAPLNGYLKQHYPAWLRPRLLPLDTDPWESFAASHALTVDGAIRLVPTPGHTLGHLSVAVETGRTLVLLTGDATYSETALLRGDVDGVAHDARAHRDSCERIRELRRRRSAVVLPSHDPESVRRLAIVRD